MCDGLLPCQLQGLLVDCPDGTVHMDCIDQRIEEVHGGIFFGAGFREDEEFSLGLLQVQLSWSWNGLHLQIGEDSAGIAADQQQSLALAQHRNDSILRIAEDGALGQWQGPDRLIPQQIAGFKDCGAGGQSKQDAAVILHIDSPQRLAAGFHFDILNRAADIGIGFGPPVRQSGCFEQFAIDLRAYIDCAGRFGQDEQSAADGEQSGIRRNAVAGPESLSRARVQHGQASIADHGDSKRRHRSDREVTTGIPGEGFDAVFRGDKVARVRVIGVFGLTFRFCQFLPEHLRSAIRADVDSIHCQQQSRQTEHDEVAGGEGPGVWSVPLVISGLHSQWLENPTYFSVRVIGGDAVTGLHPHESPAAIEATVTEDRDGAVRDGGGEFTDGQHGAVVRWFSCDSSLPWGIRCLQQCREFRGSQLQHGLLFVRSCGLPAGGVWSVFLPKLQILEPCRGLPVCVCCLPVGEQLLCCLPGSCSGLSGGLQQSHIERHSDFSGIPFQ